MEDQDPKYLSFLNETMERIDNPVLHINRADIRAKCEERAQEIRKKLRWSLSDVVQLGFYEVAGNANPNRNVELLKRLSARANACLLKLLHEGTDHMWALFGIQPGTLEHELVKAKETVSALLHEAHRIQEELDVERMEKEALAAKLQTVTQALEKTRTDLAEADFRLHEAQEELALQASKVVDADTVSELAKAKVLIEHQRHIIEKYQAEQQAKSKFDEECLEALDFVAAMKALIKRLK